MHCTHKSTRCVHTVDTSPKYQRCFTLTLQEYVLCTNSACMHCASACTTKTADTAHMHCMYLPGADCKRALHVHAHGACDTHTAGTGMMHTVHAHTPHVCASTANTLHAHAANTHPATLHPATLQHSHRRTRGQGLDTAGTTGTWQGGSLPTSNSLPCSWKVWQHPPAWSCCSSTSTRLPTLARVPAAARPPMPLPMTTASRSRGTRAALNPEHGANGGGEGTVLHPAASTQRTTCTHQGQTDRQTDGTPPTHPASAPGRAPADPSPAAGEGPWGAGRRGCQQGTGAGGPPAPEPARPGPAAAAAAWPTWLRPRRAGTAPRGLCTLRTTHPIGSVP